MISLKRSLPNVNHRAYRRLSGLVGFRRPLEFGLDRPRLSPRAACLGPAYGLARWEHWMRLWKERALVPACGPPIWPNASRVGSGEVWEKVVRILLGQEDVNW